MQKLVYLFDEKNKNFIGSEQAYIDPLETQIKGENVYLLPANATFQEPPADVPAGQVAVFNGSWEIVTDNRGKKILKSDDLGSYVAESEEIEPAEHILTDAEISGLDAGELIIDGGQIIPKPQAQKDAERIDFLKSQLANTDYKAIKIAEGSATIEEYATDIAERQSWRAEINALGG